MRRGLAALLGVSAIAVVFACSSFSGDSPPATDPDASPPDGADAAALPEPEPQDSGLTPDAPPPCTQAILAPGTLRANAFMGPASPDQFRPDISVCNMGVGRCVFSFDLPPEAVTAIASAKAFEIRLTLTRAMKSEECGTAADHTCPDSFRAEGDLIGFPVLSDWMPDKLSWNQRKDKSPWQVAGADGPADIGKQAGSQHVLASDDTVILLLEPAQFTSTFTTGNRIAIRTSFTAGQARKPFNAVTSATKAHQATPYTPPSLSVLFCP